ncbi:MAG: cation diffusion facilitator family transporter, partial [Clostridia bacterium]|nr:cation diffusion facilitator family transporter [Clostridia bacterium]
KSFVVFLILIISIIVKLWMSLFYRKVGKIISSSVLMANSKDSFNDVISTGAVFLTTLLYAVTDINLDGYVGLIVALFIMYAGFGVLKETFDNILGTVPDAALVRSITEKLNSYEGVLGIHDLVVHSYGPEKYFASVHVEVPYDVDILLSHDMIDNIEREFREIENINLVIHLDPIVTDDEEVNELKAKTIEIVKGINSLYGVHDFRMVRGETHSNLIFDVGIPVGDKITEGELKEKISSEVGKIDEKLFCVITVDRNLV